MFIKNTEKDKNRSEKICLLGVFYGLLILYFQYSKHKWKISQPDHWLEWLSVLHAELFIFIIVIGLLLFIRFFQKYSFWVLTSYYLISFFDFICWITMDRPFHPMDVLNAIDFVRHYPEFIKQVWCKLLVLLSVPLLSYAFWIKNGLWMGSKSRWISPKYVFAGGAFFYLLLLPFVFKTDYLQNNTMVKIPSEIYWEYMIKKRQVTSADIHYLFGESPELQHANSLDGNNKKKIVILFIIETAPFQFYDLFGEELHTLANKTNVMKINSLSEHYTTYPESDRSIYSILSGNYPPLTRGTSWIRRADYQYSLPNTLKIHGYKTYFISTAPLDFHDNREMVEKMGFDNIIESNKAKKEAQTFVNGKLHWNRNKLYEADLELLESAIQIIQDQVRHPDTPYLLVLAPQSSHAPFQKPPGTELTENPGEDMLIRANASWQFRLIEKIINELINTEMIGDAMMIITGDHGIRSIHESETLFTNPHFLNPLTFHVPFWILNQRDSEFVLPETATSHVDIVPTILDLLDIRYDHRSYHGRNMQNYGKRFVFFLGGDYLPTSGFKWNKRFFMENRFKGIVDVNNTFVFPSRKTPSSNSKNSTADNEVDVLGTFKLVKSLLMNRPNIVQ